MGEKNEQKNKPFWKKWWFWVIIVIVLGVGAISGGSQDNGEGKKSAETMKTAENDTKEDKGSDVPEPAKEEDDYGGKNKERAIRNNKTGTAGTRRARRQPRRNRR